MIKDQRSGFERKLASAKRLFLWNIMSKSLGIILVSEFPKSGGTWLSQLISDVLDLPYPRNITPKVEKSVLHGHHYFNNRFNTPICMIRDGRDVMVSYYHHMFFGNSIQPTYVLEKYKHQFGIDNPEDVMGNLPRYIEQMFTNYSLGGVKTDWKSFIESYLGKKDVVLVKYEDLLSNTVSELSRVLKDIGYDGVEINEIKKSVDKYSFKAQSSRVAGVEQKNSFLRKGVSGDWKNYFSKEARDKFDYYAGDLLISLNYELDRKWVEE